MRCMAESRAGSTYVWKRWWCCTAATAERALASHTAYVWVEWIWRSATMAFFFSSSRASCDLQSASLTVGWATNASHAATTVASMTQALSTLADRAAEMAEPSARYASAGRCGARSCTAAMAASSCVKYCSRVSLKQLTPTVLSDRSSAAETPESVASTLVSTSCEHTHAHAAPASGAANAGGEKSEAGQVS